MTNKQLQSLSKFVARKGYKPRPEIEKIHVANGKAEATDSYCLLQLSVGESGENVTELLPGLYEPKTGERNTNPKLENTYPVLEPIIKECTKEKEKTVTLTINAKYLFRMAQALKDFGRPGLNDIQITVTEPTSPMVFRGVDDNQKPFVGMIMPIRNA